MLYLFLLPNFSTTINFLVAVDTEGKVQTSLKDSELINQILKISALPDEEKTQMF